jgi:lipopolysaccharide transport system permease protein
MINQSSSSFLKIFLIFKLGINEYITGLKNYQSWFFLGYHEILLKYRRSILGPIWSTITVTLLIILLSFLWSKIFSLKLDLYVPYFSIGYILWIFFSNTLNEACSVLSENTTIIKQTNIPVLSFSLKLLFKNIFLLAHNFIIIIIVLLLFCDVYLIDLLVSLSFLILMFVFLTNLSVFISIVSARFFDFSQLVINLIQLAFFLTPIIWEPSFLGDKIWVTQLNPLYHWFDFIRQPLIGGDISNLSLAVIISTLISSFILAIFSIGLSYKKIPLWL